MFEKVEITITQKLVTTSTTAASPTTAEVTIAEPTTTPVPTTEVTTAESTTATLVTTQATTEPTTPEQIVIDDGEEIEEKGWEQTGTRFAQNNHDLPPYMPREIYELDGKGIWYWYLSWDGIGSPNVNFRSKSDTYENAGSITLNIKYFARLTRTDTSPIYIQPVKCSNLYNSTAEVCSKEIPKSNKPNIWSQESVGIEVASLPVCIVVVLFYCISTKYEI